MPHRAGTWVKVLFLVTGALLALGPGQASRKEPEQTSKADINPLQYKLPSEIGKGSTTSLDSRYKQNHKH